MSFRFTTLSLKFDQLGSFFFRESRMGGCGACKAPLRPSLLVCGICVALVLWALAPCIAASNLPPSSGHVPQAGYLRQGASVGAQYGSAPPPGGASATPPGSVPAAGGPTTGLDPRTALPICGRIRGPRCVQALSVIPEIWRGGVMSFPPIFESRCSIL